MLYILVEDETHFYINVQYMIQREISFCKLYFLNLVDDEIHFYINVQYKNVYV